jgi:hypothetical protein
MHPAQASPSELAVSLSSAATRRPSVRSPPKRCLTCPRVRTPPRPCPWGSPDPRQRPFGPGHQARYPASYPGPPAEGASHRCPGFLLPFGHRHSLLGSSCSRPGTGPSLRPAYRAPLGARTRTGLPRSAPASNGRAGCPLYPGDGGAHPGRMPCPAVACRFSAASPCTPLPHPTGEAPFYEASTRVHAIHPSGLPLTCGLPDGTAGPWAFPCAPHPAVTGSARQGGAGR